MTDDRTKAPGEVGTYEHCGDMKVHHGHYHQAIFNEGPTLPMFCWGTSLRDIYGPPLHEKMPEAPDLDALREDNLVDKPLSVESADLERKLEDAGKRITRLESQLECELRNVEMLQQKSQNYFSQLFELQGRLSLVAKLPPLWSLFGDLRGCARDLETMLTSPVHFERCETCDATGSVWPTETKPVECPACKGEGIRWVVGENPNKKAVDELIEMFAPKKTCSECGRDDGPGWPSRTGSGCPKCGFCY